MNNLLIIVSVFLITLLGLSVIYQFRLLKGTVLEVIPYGFGIGSGIVVLQLIIYSLLHIPWNVWSLLLPLVLFILFVYIKNTLWQYHIRLPQYRLTKLQLFFLFIIILLCIFVVFEAQLRPLYAWDGIALWLFKAKVFFLDSGFVTQRIPYFENGYPYFLSLLITYLYLFLSHINDRAVLLLFAFYYIFLGIACFFALKKQLGITKAFVGTFLLLATQNIIRHGGRWEAGYADLSLAFYIFLTSMLLVQYASGKNHISAFLINFFLAIIVFTKNEGIAWSCFAEIVFLFLTYKTKQYRNFLYGCIWLGTIVGWIMYKNTHPFVLELFLNQTSLHIERFPQVIFYMAKESFSLDHWNLLWIAFYLATILFLFNRKRPRSLWIVFLFIFGQLAIYGYIFLRSPFLPSEHIPNVMDRLYLHVAPLALYTTMISFFHKK